MCDRGNTSRIRELGITQRATPLNASWTGELRVRFTDFQVNEIGPDGKVLHLRTIGLGETKDDKKNGDDGSAAAAAAAVEEEETFEVPEEDVTTLSNIAGEKFTQDLVAMLKASGEPDAHRKRVTGEADTDRSKRGQIHQEVRRIFQSRIDTSTSDTGAIVASLVTRRGKKRSRGGRDGGRDSGPKLPGAGDYLHFTLYKDNRDTMEAVNQVARMLRVKPQVIGYAGTKDRRASTVQRCSVRYARPAALAGANAKLRGVVTGDYAFAQSPIHLGSLKGNEFVITIKDCHLDDGVSDTPTKTLDQRLEDLRSNAQAALDHMARHGWINYFGHQRFGTHRIGTHEVGRLILSERYKEAVESLLSYDAEDHSLAEQLMPRRFGAETCILRHLNRAGAKSRGDHVGALIHITRGLRSMYLHAYQSHVWNHVASRRWELYGDKVVKGDLVQVDDNDAAADAAAAEPERDQDGHEIITPAAADIAADDDDQSSPMRARPLTQAEADSGRYTIHDVFLPSPGYEVVYPDNDIGAYYAEFMGRPENGSLDPHSMRRIRREFSLPGRYRRLVNCFLAEPSVEFRTYARDTEQMHPTDLDVVRASLPKRVRKTEGADERNDEVAREEGKEEEEEQLPDKIAAIVRFQLGSSAYATVTLRELMGDGLDKE
ncbi:tRNA pseudouridine13 synthase [Geosmithia morbida]|uniref:tRNA pseudouridine13 synthase n=1 Tax=Geosmithia morbida TaxID=1094350 RepID=A0A9P5D2Z2_9HYPO|nr:tRNA pseudouridine13 synthase [Geosmithia morbida]KAF4121280.1 tRNA pseudouridine13 synthase [Geosmithia morbida]